MIDSLKDVCFTISLPLRYYFVTISISEGWKNIERTKLKAINQFNLFNKSERSQKMAELKKKVLGQVTGAVGDMVFRERYGLNYISTRPTSFMPGMDPASIARRGRFALTAKTSVSINRIAELKALWSAAAPSGKSGYNYIFQSNYAFISPSDVTDLLKIVPDNGFGITITGNTINNTSVQAVIGPLGIKAGINATLEAELMMTCVEFLSDPIDESVGAYSLLSLTSGKVPTTLTDPITFDADLTSQQSLVFDKYQTYKVFIAVLTLDATGKPVHYSSSVMLT
jgi:hypothetical protein